jgi:predicted MFS family arabinose efflux permease
MGSQTNSPRRAVSNQRAAVSAALAGAIALAAAIGVGRFVYTPILPPMVEALGLSKSAAGLIASANFLGYLLGAQAAAMFPAPGSRRSWLLGALAISAITTGAMGLTQSMPLFLALRLVGGAASALVLVLSTVLVLEQIAAADRAGLSSLCFAGVGIGIAVSAVLVAGLAWAGATWQWLWLASGAISLLATVVVALILRERTCAPQQAEDKISSASARGLARLIIAYGLFGFGYVITATFLVAIVRGTPAVRPLEPVIWLLFGLAAAPSVALWMRVATRLGVPRTFALACVLEATGVAASVVWPSTAGVFLSAILVGGTFMGITALGLVQARALMPNGAHRVLAYMTAAFGVGQIIGPAFAGALSDRLESFTVPSVAAAIALLVAAALTRKD